MSKIISYRDAVDFHFAGLVDKYAAEIAKQVAKNGYKIIK